MFFSYFLLVLLTGYQIDSNDGTQTMVYTVIWILGSALKSGPVSVLLPLFGRTANRSGPRKLQNARTVDWNHKKPQKTGQNWL